MKRGEFVGQLVLRFEDMHRKREEGKRLACVIGLHHPTRYIDSISRIAQEVAKEAGLDPARFATRFRYECQYCGEPCSPTTKTTSRSLRSTTSVLSIRFLSKSLSTTKQVTSSALRGLTAGTEPSQSDMARTIALASLLNFHTGRSTPMDASVNTTAEDEDRAR